MSEKSERGTSYMRLNPTTGKLEVVDPAPPATDGPKKRTRLETDREVRARVRAISGCDLGAYVGRALDQRLKELGYQPRRHVEEAA